MSVYNNNPPQGAYHEGVSPNTVSPQTTGYLTTHDQISPQVTGVTSQPHPEAAPSHPETQKFQPPQDHYQGIEVVPNMDHQSPAPEYSAEKGPMGGQQVYPDGQYPQQQNYPPQEHPQGQYPPQGHYAPQQQAPVTQGRNNYQTAMPIRSLQQGPQPVDCPVCNVREVTAVNYVSGTTTHLSALLCCCVICLGCIPYMASAFKDVEHKCGHCGALLAVWHRSGRTEVVAPGLH